MILLHIIDSVLLQGKVLIQTQLFFYNFLVRILRRDLFVINII